MILANADSKRVTGGRLRSKRGKTRYSPINADSEGLSGMEKGGRKARRRQEETGAEFIANDNRLM